MKTRGTHSLSLREHVGFGATGLAAGSQPGIQSYFNMVITRTKQVIFDKKKKMYNYHKKTTIPYELNKYYVII